MPVCLPGDSYVCYGGAKAVVTSYKMEEDGALNPYNLTKSEKSLILKSDRDCELNPKLKICSFAKDLDFEADIQVVGRIKSYESIRKSFKSCFFFCVKVDYGSPLVVKNVAERRWFQVGVTSNTAPNKHMVEFTRLTNFVQWIQDTIENN